MKIRQWLGYNEDASQYLLRPGELRVLNNLQARRPGMLLSRRGLTKIYGKYDNEAIYGLYRRATILGSPNDFLWLQKVLVEKELTGTQLAAQEYGFEYVWMLRRIEGYQSRIIDTLPITPTGSTSPISNMCVAEDRHGRMFVFYGHGVEPRLYRPSDLANVAIPIGLLAPKSAPSVLPEGTGYFIENVDVKSGGGSYFEPPALTLVGGSPDRAAKLKAIVQSGNVVGVDIVDGGLNYKSPPRIEVASDKVGTGFRARGTISSSARTVSGFSESASATITGTAASATQTYGSTDGTTGNSILYRSSPTVAKVRILSAAGANLTLNNVTGIQNGDTVTVYPAAAPFNAGTVTVTAVNISTNVVTVSSNAFSPVANTSYEATFQRASTIAQAEAAYDTNTRRFRATIPLSSASATGKGAQATLEFSPSPLGFGLNAANNASITAINRNWQTYRPISGGTQRFLYDEYWAGSDFDVKGSGENSIYGGLQAHGNRRVRGRSGTVNGRRADVYWPDYSAISVWFCTGQYSGDDAHWQRVNVTVETEIDPNTNISAKVLRFRLKPAKRARAARRIGGATLATDYSPYDDLPDPVAPEVKLYLRECPDSWVANDFTQCLPTQEKEAQPNRLPWWSPQTTVPRPIVDIRPSSQTPITADLVTITDAGRGWAKGQVFAFRLYQANAYAQTVDYNTAVVEDAKRAAHVRESTKYVEFRFTANTPDNLTPHGPPQTLLTPATVTIPGDGYATGATGTVTLLRRDVGAAASTAVAAQTLTWSAATLDTLSAQSTGSIASITILNKGQNYFAPPTVLVRGGGNGYGLAVTPTVENGRIESVQITDPGASYTSAPELYTSARAAELTTVMRPAMRGKYRCAYRYVDRTETVVATATASRLDSPTTLSLTGYGAAEIKPDMLVEGTGIPFGSKIKSVNGAEVEINQEITALANTGAPVWQSDPARTATPRSSNSASRILTGSFLDPGEAIRSPNGRYELKMETGGDLTITDLDTSTVIWNAGTSIAGSRLSFGGLGRMTIRLGDDLPHWSTQTFAPGEYPNAELELLNSGNLVIFAARPTTTVTIRDLTKPIAYSDLSPIFDVDAGPNDSRTHCSKLVWSLPGATPPDRADMVELWRTSADQSLVFYRLEAYGAPGPNGVEIVGGDTLTDEQLFDPDRANYAAMPVVLPNGSVNAYRFGRPRTDMAVGVAFQDRLWMGASTSGKDVNTLFYSEFDEFESFPDVNELPIQNNQKNTDVLTALVPFGSMLLAMQHSHTYAVSYNTDPAVDASIQMMAHRGCLHQRGWDIHENVLYAADESGIYSMARNGEVKDISLPIRDFFVSELIDFSKRETFFLQTDPRTHILRFFCTLKTNPTDTPAFALCFDIQAGTWWTESYPNSLTAACTGRPSDARLTTILLGGVDGNLYEIAGDSDHANDSLTDAFVTAGGSGYREAPAITVPNCTGAVVRGVVSEGRLVDVIIQSAGWAASWGIGLLAENNSPLATHDGLALQGVEYDAIKLDIGAPEPGGVQAVAYANYTVTPLVRRLCTVSKGQDYVRLKPRRLTTIEPAVTANLSSELSALLTTEATAPIRLETPVAEIGMEAIGPFIPLNAFVSRIDGQNIHLTHPDGTPVSMLFGAARVYGPPAGQTWIDQQESTILSYNSIGELFANSTAIKFWGNRLTMAAFAANNETPLAAERINGVNQLLYRNNTFGFLAAWSMTDSWEYLSTLESHSLGTAAAKAMEERFRVDATGDGLVGNAPGWLDYGGTEMEVMFRKPFRTHVPFRMATGFMQLVNEDNAKGGDGLIDRSVTVVYTPTQSDKEVEIIERFNGRDEMRANLMRRDRGGPGGFVHRQDSASTVLNTSREASHLGFATGVAKAKFASRVYTDMTGEDQHLQVELYGRPEQASPWERTNFWIANDIVKQPHQFVLHSLNLNGVVEDAE
jgi:hypothetical protein